MLDNICIVAVNMYTKSPRLVLPITFLYDPADTDVNACKPEREPEAAGDTSPGHSQQATLPSEVSLFLIYSLIALVRMLTSLDHRT